jgi:hypothetical protein
VVAELRDTLQNDAKAPRLLRTVRGVGSCVLSDADADEIRRGLAAGLRGPLLIKWCRLLLADRDERRAREQTMRGPWPGPLAGPPS